MKIKNVVVMQHIYIFWNPVDEDDGKNSRDNNNIENDIIIWYLENKKHANNNDVVFIIVNIILKKSKGNGFNFSGHIKCTTNDKLF